MTPFNLNGYFLMKSLEMIFLLRTSIRLVFKFFMVFWFKKYIENFLFICLIFFWYKSVPFIVILDYFMLLQIIFRFRYLLFVSFFTSIVKQLTLEWKKCRTLVYEKTLVSCPLPPNKTPNFSQFGLILHLLTYYIFLHFRWLSKLNFMWEIESVVKSGNSANCHSLPVKVDLGNSIGTGIVWKPILLFS